jgi:hypothetical protein
LGEFHALWCSLHGAASDTKRLRRHWPWKWLNGSGGREQPPYLLALRADE